MVPRFVIALRRKSRGVFSWGGELFMEFQIKSRLTKEDIRQYLRFWNRTMNGMVNRRIMIGTALLLASLLFLGFRAEGGFFAGFQKYGILWGLFFGIVYFLLIRNYWDYKRMSALMEIELERNFRERGIESIQPFTIQYYEYAGITDIYHNGNGFYLIMPFRVGMILPERCFTQGDPAAFGAFLAEKTGLKVKEIK